ncbi:hypothetical protein M0R88_03705 [Halorussus gelatinilyticus]|uniref:Molybdopterin cofactor biosynthesis MoaD-related C-terminal domain-containing protein n=1 Tax=Halorussus gelatinilyticus TaxID=2937524 RepID=A0A8U0IKL4_9EURY|nr:hypothetical protein [Halorussus gelatinilyticus]UPW01216.1 hypothetical protein M0R88_03705 [Halorussus gelatinilyticus]
MTRVEKSFRGISERLARRYLSNLGGEIEGGDPEGDGDVIADEWRASVSSEKVQIGASMTLTEVTVVFEGEEGVLDGLIEKFSQKAMRAGG